LREKERWNQITFLSKKKYNTIKNGYGKWKELSDLEEHVVSSFTEDERLEIIKKKKFLTIWAKFYGCENLCFPTYDELIENYKDIETGITEDKLYYFSKGSQYREAWFFNIGLFKIRILRSLENFLFDANDRGKAYGKKAFCHVVGLGLGVWQVCPLQSEWFVDMVYKAVNDYSTKLPHISDIHLSWFPELNPLPELKNPNIKITFSKRNPADKLEGEDENKLIVAMYAWDGNSFPGNEYWCGMLTASGDPAAACCSTIPELQNPLVNKFFLNNIWISNEDKPFIGCENNTFVKSTL